MKYIAVILAVGCLVAACASPPPVSVSEALRAKKDEKILWHRALEKQLVLDSSGWLYRDPEIETPIGVQPSKKQPSDTDYQHRSNLTRQWQLLDRRLAEMAYSKNDTRQAGSRPQAQAGTPMQLTESVPSKQNLFRHRPDCC